MNKGKRISHILELLVTALAMMVANVPATRGQELIIDPEAAGMIVEFEGIVTGGFDGSNTLGFGAGPNALDGRSITGSIRYVPALSPADSDPAANAAIHETSIPESSDWFVVEFVLIDDMTLPSPDFGLVDPTDPFNDDLHDNDATIQLQNGDLPDDDLVDYTRVRFESNDVGDFADHTVQLVVSRIDDLIDSPDINQPYSVGDFTGSTQINFLASVSSIEGFEIFADFQLTGLTVSVECALQGLGDVDGDCDVDLDDLSAMVNCVSGPVDSAPTGCENSDIDGDDDVDLLDFAVLQQNFGS